MRRTAVPTAALLAAGLLLTACGGAADVADGEQAEPAASGRASAPADEPVVAEPPAIEGLEVLAEDPSHEHVEGPLEYDRVPPLGGEHNPRWLACDVYDEPVPHEFAVHSLEHGAVWLAHSPDLPADQVDLLAELAGTDREYVLVSPGAGAGQPRRRGDLGRRARGQRRRRPAAGRVRRGVRRRGPGRRAGRALPRQRRHPARGARDAGRLDRGRVPHAAAR